MPSAKELARFTKKELAVMAGERGLSLDASVKVHPAKDVFITAILDHDSLNEKIERNISDSPTAEVVNPEATDDNSDLDGMTRPKLQQIAKLLSLKVSGKKADLIDRIREAQQNDPAAEKAAKKAEETQGSSSKKPASAKLSSPPTEYFCCVDRASFPSENEDPPGLAVLRTGCIFIKDSISGKEHQLRVRVQDDKSALPEGFLDNVVCRACIDRNRAMGLFEKSRTAMTAVAEYAVHPRVSESSRPSFPFNFTASAGENPIVNSPARNSALPESLENQKTAAESSQAANISTYNSIRNLAGTPVISHKPIRETSSEIVSTPIVAAKQGHINSNEIELKSADSGSNSAGTPVVAQMAKLLEKFNKIKPNSLNNAINASVINNKVVEDRTEEDIGDPMDSNLPESGDQDSEEEHNRSVAFLDETLQDISIISTTADEVLAELDLYEDQEKIEQDSSFENNALNQFQSTPKASILASSFASGTSRPSLEIAFGSSKSSTQKPSVSVNYSPKTSASPRSNTTPHRKPIKQPLAIALAQRRISSKLSTLQVVQRNARDEKVDKTRRESHSFASAQQDLDDDGNNDIDGFNSGSRAASFESEDSSSESFGESGRKLKLPTPAKERKARGEVLWKQPASRLPSASGRNGSNASSYVAVEDEKIVKVVESILETTQPGDIEEWNIIAARNKPGLRRSP
ncbi:hypothetical protein HK100_010378 [Physocladia obscura]|uniref:SAP domain-containing protein n=1 Tax=Physocladia obscura TaxID=109957 RepID=A0AAD5XH17_9FUNG|nr:hypothetical protein HK100_010378 [Physocladia obscura]